MFLFVDFFSCENKSCNKILKNQYFVDNLGIWQRIEQFTSIIAMLLCIILCKDTCILYRKQIVIS